MSQVSEATTIIGELETSLGMPVIVFLSHWQGEYAVDPGEDGGRLLSKVMVEVYRRHGEPRQMALVLLGRGGESCFADQVLRCAEHLDIELDVVVPHRIDGATALLALGADRITLHPGGGIGAVDRGLLVTGRQRVDSDIQELSGLSLRDLASLPESEKGVITRVARERLVCRDLRRLARRHIAGDKAQWAMMESLGKGAALGQAELQNRGLDVRVAPGPLAEQLDELLEWGIDFMHLFEDPSQRFEVSAEVADEVEFEPATTVPAAVILEAESGYLYELDTGSPDPYAPRLLGGWSSWEPRALDGECSVE